jgi:myo-inositol-1(or 4)-monophosphatase
MDDLALLEAAAREAGALALSHFGRPVAVWNKEPGHPVTEVDLAVDALLYSHLRRARPGYGWLSEETAEDAHERNRARVFVVDPIDGTRAFMTGLPHWCIGLACLHEGQTVAGVVFNPVTGEFFSAAQGQGAFLNGQPIRTASRDTLQGSRLIAPEGVTMRRDLRTPWPEVEFADPRPNATLYRMALVACGVWDATFALWHKSDWDIAPAEIIVREAGGLATTHDGQPFCFNRPHPAQKSLLAAGPALHTLLKERLGVVHLPDPSSKPRRPAPAPSGPVPEPSRETPSMPTTPAHTIQKQRLHIVFGGALKSVEGVEFTDLSKMDFVGAYGSYAEAYSAWKGAAQRTVDQAQTRYFILHAHRLLDPETGDQHEF